DQLLDFLFHRFEVEGSRVLHRRIFDCGRRQLRNVRLEQDEAPELPGKEVVHVAACASVCRLAANRRRTFKWVLAKVDHPWHIGCGLFAWPAKRLRIEREFEVIETKRAQ